MDYTPAYEFGDVCFITEFDLPLHPRSTVTRAWIQDTDKFLNTVKSEDFLILTGQPIAIFMIGCRLMSDVPPNRWPTLLVWRREQGKYVTFDARQVMT
jgi:hypothetical protein